MSSLTQLDITVRLQLSGIKIAELINTYANDLKYGRKCNNLEDLILLNAYIEMVEAYNIDSENNCITEEELSVIFDKIQQLTNLCFPPYGYTYS